MYHCCKNEGIKNGPSEQSKRHPPARDVVYARTPKSFGLSQLCLLGGVGEILALVNKMAKFGILLLIDIHVNGFTAAICIIMVV